MGILEDRINPPRPKDTRIVYAANCSWWDSIQEVARHPNSGLPCCPYCGSVLYELPTEEEWWAAVDEAAEHRMDSEYRAFMVWLRGRCFNSLESARETYNNLEDKSK